LKGNNKSKKMRTIIQRVSKASVTIAGCITAEITAGFLILLGIEDADTDEDIQWLSQKIVQLRIFSDSEGLMNLSIKDIEGEILLVSQFTLFASTKKGNRPSFIRAAKPEIAIPLYEKMIAQLEELLGKKISTGVFGADMQISLVNDGPVTIIIDTKDKS
jgi:D-aminoacyl-tRNA deacylase